MGVMFPRNPQRPIFRRETPNCSKAARKPAKPWWFLAAQFVEDAGYFVACAKSAPRIPSRFFCFFSMFVVEIF